MIARLHRRHALADLDHDPRALMPQNGREKPFGVRTGQGEFVGVADAGGLDLDEHFAGFRPGQVHVHDFKGFTGLRGNGGARFHKNSP